MTKQVYDIIRKEESIDILKNDEIIYSIDIAQKSINLQKLYEQMQVGIEDEIFVKQQFEKIEEPKNDADRIYNNTVDFMNRLLCAVNSKLINLREKQENSIFE